MTAFVVGKFRNASIPKVTLGPGWWLLPSLAAGGWVWYAVLSALLG
ncbi:MAG: hypothetical protein Q8K20_14650 [Gemmobacter sp.]|nr:hypothetical protein [Gemmobacter sp.]